MKWLVLAFFIYARAVGIWSVLAPSSFRAIWRRTGWSTSFLSGGWVYATDRRARVTGTIVTAISLWAIVHMLVQ